MTIFLARGAPWDMTTPLKIAKRYPSDLFSAGRLFRDDDAHRCNPFSYEADIVRRCLGEIDVAAAFSRIWSPAGDLELRLFSRLRFSTMTSVPNRSWRWAAVISF